MGDIFSSIESGLASRGFTFDQARGITAGIYAESGGSLTARNPTSGAFGLEQLLGSRKTGLLNTYGPNPTLDNQLDYLTMELRGGDAGGKSVLAAQGQGNILTAYITKFMRPAAGAQTTGDLTRGNSYLANNGAKINSTIGDAIASFSPTLGGVSNSLGEALSAPGEALGAATDKLFGGLDLSGWFQRIALAILAILLIGIALSMLASKAGVNVVSKVPVPLPV